MLLIIQYRTSNFDYTSVINVHYELLPMLPGLQELDVITGAGGGFGSVNTTGPTTFDGQLFNITFISEYVPHLRSHITSCQLVLLLEGIDIPALY